MDQVKDILRQMVKHRFWILVGISAILPIAAYFAAAGGIQKEAADLAASYEGAYKGVQPFTSGSPVNAQYTPVVQTRKEALDKDVKTVWRDLYDRQAKLLTWPKSVNEKLTAWGRRWPDESVAGFDQIQRVIDLYQNDYPRYVDNVYKIFDPFDYATGNGVVVAPPKEALLTPVAWDKSQVAKLNEVWAAQERLWAQAAMLQVVRDVNGPAKTWDDAPIRQINALEVGSATAMDQISIADGKMPEEMAFENDQDQDESADAAGGGGMMDMGMMMEQMGGRGGGGMMPGMLGGGPGGMGGAGMKDRPDQVQYVQSDTPMFQIVPVYMSVMVKQDRIVDFLVGLQNSPMAIQVLELEMSRPKERIKKPEKGQAMTDFSGYGGLTGLGGRGMMMDMGMMMGMGGMMPPGMGGMMDMGMMEGMGGRGMMMDMGMMMGMGGMGGRGAAGKAIGKGETFSRDLKKEREEAKKAALRTDENKAFDPYYDIVQVSVYGQARFYNKPAEEQPESRSAETPPADDAAGE